MHHKINKLINKRLDEKELFNYYIKNIELSKGYVENLSTSNLIKNKELYNIIFQLCASIIIFSVYLVFFTEEIISALSCFILGISVIFSLKFRVESITPIQPYMDYDRFISLQDSIISILELIRDDVCNRSKMTELLMETFNKNDSI